MSYSMWVNYGATIKNGKCGVSAIVIRGDKRAVLAGTIDVAPNDPDEVAWKTMRWAYDKMIDKKLPIIIKFRSHEARAFIESKEKFSGEKGEFVKFLRLHPECTYEFAEQFTDFEQYMRARIYANEVKLA